MVFPKIYHFKCILFFSVGTVTGCILPGPFTNYTLFYWFNKHITQVKASRSMEVIQEEYDHAYANHGTVLPKPELSPKVPPTLPPLSIPPPTVPSPATSLQPPSCNPSFLPRTTKQKYGMVEEHVYDSFGNTGKSVESEESEEGEGSCSGPSLDYSPVPSPVPSPSSPRPRAVFIPPVSVLYSAHVALCFVLICFGIPVLFVFSASFRFNCFNTAIFLLLKRIKILCWQLIFVIFLYIAIV